MIILVDANVILSAYAFGSRRIQALLEAISTNHEMVIPEQVVDECVSVTARKSPRRVEAVERFFASPGIKRISMSMGNVLSETEIRDESDRPILETAIASQVDIILTGDGDFHALDLERPRFMTPSQFVDEFMNIESQ